MREISPDQLQTIRESLQGARGDDQKRIAETGMRLTELLLRKNKDYGGSAWQVPVMVPTIDCKTAMRVRMSDKIARIHQLEASGDAQVKTESIFETWDDFAGYLILYVSYLEKENEQQQDQVERS